MRNPLSALAAPLPAMPSDAPASLKQSGERNVPASPAADPAGGPAFGDLIQAVIDQDKAGEAGLRPAPVGSAANQLAAGQLAARPPAAGQPLAGQSPAVQPPTALLPVAQSATVQAQAGHSQAGAALPVNTRTAETASGASSKNTAGLPPARGVALPSGTPLPAAAASTGGGVAGGGVARAALNPIPTSTAPAPPNGPVLRLKTKQAEQLPVTKADAGAIEKPVPVSMPRQVAAATGQASGSAPAAQATTKPPEAKTAAATTAGDPHPTGASTSVAADPVSQTAPISQAAPISQNAPVFTPCIGDLAASRPVPVALPADRGQASTSPISGRGTRAPLESATALSGTDNPAGPFQSMTAATVQPVPVQQDMASPDSGQAAVACPAAWKPPTGETAAGKTAGDGDTLPPMPVTAKKDPFTARPMVGPTVTPAAMADSGLVDCGQASTTPLPRTPRGTVTNLDGHGEGTQPAPPAAVANATPEPDPAGGTSPPPLPQPSQTEPSPPQPAAPRNTRAPAVSATAVPSPLATSTVLRMAELPAVNANAIGAAKVTAAAEPGATIAAPVTGQARIAQPALAALLPDALPLAPPADPASAVPVQARSVVARSVVAASVVAGPAQPIPAQAMPILVMSEGSTTDASAIPPIHADEPLIAPTPTLTPGATQTVAAANLLSISTASPMDANLEDASQVSKSPVNEQPATARTEFQAAPFRSTPSQLTQSASTSNGGAQAAGPAEAEALLAGAAPEPSIGPAASNNSPNPVAANPVRDSGPIASPDLITATATATAGNDNPAPTQPRPPQATSSSMANPPATPLAPTPGSAPVSSPAPVLNPAPSPTPSPISSPSPALAASDALAPPQMPTASRPAVQAAPGTGTPAMKSATDAAMAASPAQAGPKGDAVSIGAPTPDIAVIGVPASGVPVGSVPAGVGQAGVGPAGVEQVTKIETEAGIREKSDAAFVSNGAAGLQAVMAGIAPVDAAPVDGAPQAGPAGSNHRSGDAPPASVAAQVLPSIVSIAHAGGSGVGSRLSVSITPDELGQVSITVERAADGTTNIHVAAERLATLDLLRADQADLVQALHQASGDNPEGGSHSLSFSWNGGGSGQGWSGQSWSGQGWGAPGGESGQQRSGNAARSAAKSYVEDSASVSALTAMARGGVDVTA